MASVKRLWFHLALVLCTALPIIALAFLDYYDLDGYNYRYNGETGDFEVWRNTYFNGTFVFELTWKGRMFLLVFLWLMLVESAIEWRKLVAEKPDNRRIMAASLICTLVPTAYILATSFCGFDLTVLKMGQILGIRSVTSLNEPWDFLHLYWPISLEYIVFAMFFIGAIMLAYKTKGLKVFSISLALLAGIGIAYMFDTIVPWGIFRPLQAFALPTAAVSAALLDLMGYAVRLVFPVYSVESNLPSLTVTLGGNTATVAIAWACAGVQSLLLYVVIIFVFFKKAEISAFRKLAYFVIGLFGTFFVNVLRVTSILLIMLASGKAAGEVFHNTYGEMYSVIWILLFILLIGFIERFMLVERTKHAFHRIIGYLGAILSSLSVHLSK
jgi:exosortase/archaeosortase family protein